MLVTVVSSWTSPSQVVNKSTSLPALLFPSPNHTPPTPRVVRLKAGPTLPERTVASDPCLSLTTDSLPVPALRVLVSTKSSLPQVDLLPVTALALPSLPSHTLVLPLSSTIKSLQQLGAWRSRVWRRKTAWGCKNLVFLISSLATL